MKLTHKVITSCISLVWIVNGLCCKILNVVPRHTAIVATILGEGNAHYFTLLIGCMEILMAVWILSRIQPRLNALSQIGIVATMNVIECILAPNLLLWGRYNALFALLFCFVVFINEFYLNKTLSEK